MKLSQLIVITGILSISITSAYYELRQENTDKINVTSNIKTPDLSKEIALLKAEIKELKTAEAEHDESQQYVTNNYHRKREKHTQSELTKNGTMADEAMKNEAETAEQFNPEEEGKKIAEERKKQQESLDQAFLAETSDPEWSPETTTLVSNFFEAKVGANVDLSDVQCRKTLCKIEVNQTGGANGADNFMLSFPMHVSKALGHATLYHEQNADGSTRVTMYVARNGHDLPNLN